mmetsp:Transcript_10964/g.67834  ORF Transcript_10964/g.67834 Transcript_10964/m.67834 type:complete len:311 (-) Transcript_10964:56-988(-)
MSGFGFLQHFFDPGSFGPEARTEGLHVSLQGLQVRVLGGQPLQAFLAGCGIAGRCLHGAVRTFQLLQRVRFGFFRGFDALPQVVLGVLRLRLYILHGRWTVRRARRSDVRIGHPLRNSWFAWEASHRFGELRMDEIVFCFPIHVVFFDRSSVFCFSRVVSYQRHAFRQVFFFHALHSFASVPLRTPWLVQDAFFYFLFFYPPRIARVLRAFLRFRFVPRAFPSISERASLQLFDGFRRVRGSFLLPLARLRHFHLAHACASIDVHATIRPRFVHVEAQLRRTSTIGSRPSFPPSHLSDALGLPHRSARPP